MTRRRWVGPPSSGLGGDHGAPEDREARGPSLRSTARDEAQVGSVRHLQALYAAVGGVGMAVAIETLLRGSDNHVEVAWRSLPVVAAYLVTLVPFYHGAQRHLDQQYVIDPVASSRAGQLLLADFTVLFIESCLLFALAILIEEPLMFGWTLLSLLALDTAWSLAFHAATPGKRSASEVGWAKVNTAAVVGLTVTLTVSDAADLGAVAVGLMVLLVATVRTVFDYRCSWSYYFPANS